MSEDKVREIKDEIKRHEEEIKKIQSEANIDTILEEMSEISRLTASHIHKYEKIKNKFFRIICCATEGEETVIGGDYSLKNGRLYEYDTNKEVSFKKLYSNKLTHKNSRLNDIDKGRRPLREIHHGAVKKAEDEKASEEIDHLFESLKNNREEMEAAQGDYQLVYESVVKVVSRKNSKVPTYSRSYVQTVDNKLILYLFKDNRIIVCEDAEVDLSCDINLSGLDIIDYIDYEDLKNPTNNIETLVSAIEHYDSILKTLEETRSIVKEVNDGVDKVNQRLGELSPYLIREEI